MAHALRWLISVVRAIECSLALFALLATSACTARLPFAHHARSSQPAPIDELVEPNPDIAARDLYYGVGGAENAPPPGAGFRFLERDTSGMSTNFELEDAQGRRWDAKFGREARSEVAASRLLWAIGFHQPPVYYQASWRITSGKETGEQRPARLRLEQASWKKGGSWAWDDNPFVGTRELHGLVVMMAILNSWDLKTSNNKIYEVSGGRLPRVYVVKDLGESLGRSVNLFLGSESNLEQFLHERFIRDVEKDGRVHLYYKPMLLSRSVEHDLTVDDVLWTCGRLARLSERQWRDAFRAGGYNDAEVTAYVDRVKDKMRDGLALADRPRV
jgi:hypothetical protein